MRGVSSRQHSSQPYMERGVGLSLLVSLLKFNDSSAQQPGETLAAVNPRFNQVDKDAEWICVETMISSDQGRCRPPPVVRISRDLAEWLLVAAHHCVCIESDL